jgi:hypothetical protein
VETLLNELAAELQARKALDDESRSRRPTIVVGLVDPERIESLTRKPDGFGGATESPLNTIVRRLANEGPSVGMHLVVSVSDYSALTTLIDNRKGPTAFRYRALLQMSQEDSYKLTNKPFLASQLQPEGEMPICSLIFDAEVENTVRFKPYVAKSRETGAESSQGVLDELPELAERLAKRNRS